MTVYSSIFEQIFYLSMVFFGLVTGISYTLTMFKPGALKWYIGLKALVGYYLCGLYVAFFLDDFIYTNIELFDRVCRTQLTRPVLTVMLILLAADSIIRRIVYDDSARF